MFVGPRHMVALYTQPLRLPTVWLPSVQYTAPKKSFVFRLKM